MEKEGLFRRLSEMVAIRLDSEMIQFLSFFFFCFCDDLEIQLRPIYPA
jgi:hypothetical protein